MITTLPNLLTLLRIVMIVPLVGAFFLAGDFANWVALAVFVLAAITDFFDGYLARARNEMSEFGRFLDPVADKLLVAAALFMLAAFDRITAWTIIPALIILCREFMISGLREYLAGHEFVLRVSRLAKWKTTIQMVAIGILLVGDAGPDPIPVRLIGEIGLWLAAALTAVTGYDYMRVGFRHMTDRAAPPSEHPADGSDLPAAPDKAERAGRA